MHIHRIERLHIHRIEHRARLATTRARRARGAPRWIPALLGASAVLCAHGACGPGTPAPPPPRRAAEERGAPRRAAPAAPRRARPDAARCPSPPSPALALPKHLRSVRDLGKGWRLLTAGQRASERPPCAGRCPPLTTTVALLDGAGTLCWKIRLPTEHRLGPVGRAGQTQWVAGPRRVMAVSWQGKRLVTTPLSGVRSHLVALADGGAAVLDSEHHVVAFHPNGKRRWRRRLRSAARPLALAAPPKSPGLGVAFSREVRGYDADGVERYRAALPAPASARRLAFFGPRSFWVWSPRGAYQVIEGKRILDRQPPRAPQDGRLFAGVLGPRRNFHALLAERGFHPVKLLAVTPTSALHWSRPYTGRRPADCHLRVGRAGRVVIRCPGEPRGRLVVRDARGVTRFDERLVAPRAALGPRGRFAVADQQRSRDMSLQCRLRWLDAEGAAAPPAPGHAVRPGRCGLPWFDARGTLYLDNAIVRATTPPTATARDTPGSEGAAP